MKTNNNFNDKSTVGIFVSMRSMVTKLIKPAKHFLLMIIITTSFEGGR